MAVFQVNDITECTKNQQISRGILSLCTRLCESNNLSESTAGSDKAVMNHLLTFFVHSSSHVTISALTMPLTVVDGATFSSTPFIGFGYFDTLS